VAIKISGETMNFTLDELCNTLYNDDTASLDGREFLNDYISLDDEGEDLLPSSIKPIAIPIDKDLYLNVMYKF
jgi:hypothetical protein